MRLLLVVTLFLGGVVFFGASLGLAGSNTLPATSAGEVTITYSGGLKSGDITLPVGCSLAAGAAILAGSSVTGSGADELILGTSGDDTLMGGGGNDCIFGGAGDDTIDGDDGDDYIDGGGGTDTCDGGTGTNTLVNCP